MCFILIQSVIYGGDIINMFDNITDFIKKMPKIDLHCHIDGSFSPHFVKTTLGLEESTEHILDMLKAPSSCNSLAEYLTKFDLPIKCLQTKKDITAGIIDILDSASKENTKYLELRFAPTCSINENLSYEDIYEAVIEGCKQGKSVYDIDSNIIICAMRHHSLEDNLKMLEVSVDYLDYGICALDLAGDEASFNNSLFKELFARAKALNMPFTIHSGECGSTENVRLALEYGARRVGHGIALAKDKSLMEECKKAHLGLELCPTSNYQTKAVSPNDIYPLKLFLNQGLLATVNTDNRTVSTTDMTKELDLVYHNFNISEEEIIRLYKNSIEISFADDNIKNQLLKLI